MTLDSLNCRIDQLNQLLPLPATVDVLRLDQLHPMVSGNKWFKLQGYLHEALSTAGALLTFGGPYSNHIVATSAAAAENGLQAIGIIRGERPAVLSPTLVQATEMGMTIHFISREAYRHKAIPDVVWQQWSANDVCVVPEGGYGPIGMNGAMDILFKNDTAVYSHIACAVGTGTTLAGLVAAAQAGQQVTGFSVLRNENSLASEINHLLPAEKKQAYRLSFAYNFGGYARRTDELIRFMNAFYRQTKIPTDFVYTAKAFYGMFDLLAKGHFSTGDRLLLIHTGGLQGNRSLPKGTLIF